MPKEIERKFLVANDAWREHADAGTHLRQAYLAASASAVIRVRIEDDAAGFLTIKSASPGMSRDEFEYAVPLADAEVLMELRQASILRKQRFIVHHAGRDWQVDVYAGENTGLVIAEIELESETAAVEAPAWLGREVTDDSRFYAFRLAQAPYCSWPADDAAQAP